MQFEDFVLESTLEFNVILSMCTIIQWLPSYCLHVKRVERLHYVHNIDPFDVMSKGLKEYVMYTI